MPKPHRRPALQWIGLLAGSILFAAASVFAANPYLFSSFRGQGDGLHLAYSEDGRAWSDLNRVFLTPTVGGKLFRDPHILRGPDGLFRMVWTSGMTDKGIGYATSTDLIHWSEQRFLPLMEKHPAKNCWAPEIFYDDRTSRYLVTWSSHVDGWFNEDSAPGRLNNRTYYVATLDFKTFSDPALLIEPGFDHVDTTLTQWRGKYLAVFKQGDQSAMGHPGIHHGAMADSAYGPYTLVEVPLVTARADTCALLNLGSQLLLYVTFQNPTRPGAFSSADGINWTDVSSSISPVPGQSQGNIFSVPPAFLDQLRADVGSLPMPSVNSAASAASAATRSGGGSGSVPAPILEGFNADPAIRVFGDTYYIYPTADKPNWEATEFYVWSSKNLVDWKKENLLFDVTKDLGWANRRAWTPDCIERGGTWYFYFCADTRIGVATGPSPVGPFQDALGHPLLQTGGAIRTKTIAPYAFIDDDGQAYLYFGSGRDVAQAVRLNPDMTSLASDPVSITLSGFLESIVVFKREGRYYFMWTTSGNASSVGYGMADAPLGPVRRPPGDNLVMRSTGPLLHVGFNSVVNVPGTDRWYVAYHREGIPGGGPSARQVCLARMEFNPDGTIRPIDPLSAPFQPGDAGEPLVNGRGRP